MNVSINYSEKFFSCTLEELVYNYFKFEELLYNDLVSDSQEYLKSLSEKAFGNKLLRNGQVFNVRYSGYNSRDFVIMIEREDKENTAPLLNKKVQLLEIGLINRIEIHYPRGFTRIVVDILSVLATKVRSVYVSLETAFRSKFKAYENRIIRNIYERVELEIKLNLKEKLLKNYWISITKVTGFGTPEENALIFFNTETLQTALQIFKSNQTPTYSPFELICSLMFEEVPDEGLERFNEDVTEVSFDFDKMNKASYGYTRFFNAEKVLFPEKLLRSFYVCRKKNYILCINYIESLKIDFYDLLLPLKPILSNLFEENLGKKELLFGLFKKLKENKVKWEGISKFLSDFLSNTVALILQSNS